MPQHAWEPVTPRKLAGFGLGLGVFLLLLLASEPGFIFLIDHANTPFHETGHLILGLVSPPLEPYGGTLGQLVFPCVLAVTCYRAGRTLGVATAAIWFFENWLNIARYMANARLQQLPLVGGGEHDWNTIFGRWSVLQYDTGIAGAVKLAAWIGIILTCAWVLGRAWRDRTRATQAAAAA